MTFMRALATLAVAAVVTAPLAYDAAGEAQTRPASRPAGKLTSFNEQVLPLFKTHCVACHQPGGAGYEKSGLDLRSYAGVMKGTTLGPMVVPKQPEFSSMMQLLDHRVPEQIRMPHEARKLSVDNRTLIRRWILEGAQDN